MAAGSIIIDLLMRTGSFSTDTKRAERAMRELKKEANDLGRVLGTTFVAAAAGTAYFVKQAIDVADAAGKSAAAAGVAVENYTALAYAAELAGVESGAFDSSLKELNKSIAANDKALAQLGIGVRGANGELRKGDEVLAEIADRFASMPEGPRKAQLAVELFGKAGTQLIPLLNQGSAGLKQMREEAERLGIVIDTETARAAEELNDNLTRLQKSGQGLALQLAKEVLPALTELSNRALANARDFGILRGATMALFEGMLGGTEPADVLERQIASTREEIKGLQEQIKLAEQPGARQTGLDEMRERLLQLEGQAKRSTQALVDVLNIGRGNNAGAGRGSVNPARVQFDADDPAKKPKADKVSEAERYLETLKRQSEETLELTSYERALLDIQEKRLAGLTPELQRQILAQAEFNDLNKQAIEQRDAQVAATSAAARTQLDSLETLQRENAAMREEIALMDLDEAGRLAVERARVSSTRALKEETLAKLEATGASEQQLQVLQAEIEALRERESLIDKKIDRTFERESAETAKQVGDRSSETIADSIEQGILDGFRRSKDPVDIFLDELKAQFARTILRPLIQPIADAGNSVIKDIIGAIGGAIGGGGRDNSETGEVIRGRRARGGDVHPGGVYLVGEEGPEPFVPSTSGRILPNSALGGGRAPKITIENHGARIQQRTESNGDMRLIIDAAVAEVDRRIASGTGSTARALKARGLNLGGNLPRRE